MDFKSAVFGCVLDQVRPRVNIFGIFFSFKLEGSNKSLFLQDLFEHFFAPPPTTSTLPISLSNPLVFFFLS